MIVSVWDGMLWLTTLLTWLGTELHAPTTYTCNVHKFQDIFTHYNVRAIFMFLVGDCTDFTPDTSDVIECEMEGANRACNLTCNVANQDLAILEPFVLVCGPVGVLEYMNPYLSRRIPQCSRKRS